MFYWEGLSWTLFCRFTRKRKSSWRIARVGLGKGVKKERRSGHNSIIQPSDKNQLFDVSLLTTMAGNGRSLPSNTERNVFGYLPQRGPKK